MEVGLDTAGLATPLKDGDILQIIPLVTHFQKTVTLRGNTANPGRFAWHEGMHLSDLLPDRDALLTRDYWWKRAQLGLPAPEFQPIAALSQLRQPASAVDLRAPQIRRPPQPASANGQAPATPSNQQNLYASSEDPYQEFDNAQYYSTPPTTPANPQDSNNPQANPTDNPPKDAAASESSQPVRGSQSALAEQDEDSARSLNPPRTNRNVIRLNVAEIDWSYAVIERIDPTTLKTQLVPFDLGKLINQHDASQDFALQPSDIVTVFSQNDIHVPIAEQTTLVRLEGEFVHAGTYTVLPGDTLRTLVERAGGLSPNAYLYGSVYTRESTRILQQRRIDEAVHEMALEMQRGTLALAASPVSTAGDLGSVAAAQASQKELLAQLQQVRANGRIVFPFRPDSSGVSTIPDIKLENGDTFLVPSIPSTINVLGAVYNQNSFIYHSGSEVRALLDLAGGPELQCRPATRVRRPSQWQCRRPHGIRFPMRRLRRVEHDFRG